MPRLVRRKIEFNYDSLLELMQDCYNQLESMRIKAERDYNKISQIANLNKSDLVLLDNAKNNSMKILDSYYKQRLELLKIMKDTIVGRDKNTAALGASGKEGVEGAGRTSDDDKMDLIKMMENFKNKK